jgi:DNA anti-recombination protein RmuC
MSHEHEDGPPNERAPAIPPPPLTPAGLRDTDQSPPPEHDRTDEVLSAIRSLRDEMLERDEQRHRESVQRDQMLANALLNLSTTLRDEFNTKLDSVRQSADEKLNELRIHFQHELNTAATVLSGAIDGARSDILVRVNKIAYDLDAKFDERADELKGLIGGVATETADLKQVVSATTDLCYKLAKEHAADDPDSTLAAAAAEAG